MSGFNRYPRGEQSAALASASAGCQSSLTTKPSITRVQFVILPIDGIGFNVAPRGVQFGFVAQNPFPIIALPEVFIERGPIVFFDPGDVCHRAN